MSDWVDLAKRIPGLRGNRIHVLPATAEGELRATLASAGFTTRTIEGGRVTSEPAFFTEAAHALGLPAYFGRNWDAFNDALRDIVSDEQARLAILWRALDVSLARDPQTVIDAVLAFEAAAWEGIDASLERPVQLELFLLAGPLGPSR